MLINLLVNTSGASPAQQLSGHMAHAWATALTVLLGRAATPDAQRALALQTTPPRMPNQHAASTCSLQASTSPQVLIPRAQNSMKPPLAPAGAAAGHGIRGAVPATGNMSLPAIGNMQQALASRPQAPGGTLLLSRVSCICPTNLHGCCKQMAPAVLTSLSSYHCCTGAVVTFRW